MGSFSIVGRDTMATIDVTEPRTKALANQNARHEGKDRLDMHSPPVVRFDSDASTAGAMADKWDSVADDLSSTNSSWLRTCRDIIVGFLMADPELEEDEDDPEQAGGPFQSVVARTINTRVFLKRRLLGHPMFTDVRADRLRLAERDFLKRTEWFRFAERALDLEPPNLPDYVGMLHNADEDWVDPLRKSIHESSDDACDLTSNGKPQAREPEAQSHARQESQILPAFSGGESLLPLNPAGESKQVPPSGLSNSSSGLDDRTDDATQDKKMSASNRETKPDTGPESDVVVLASAESAGPGVSPLAPTKPVPLEPVAESEDNQDIQGNQYPPSPRMESDDLTESVIVERNSAQKESQELRPMADSDSNTHNVVDAPFANAFATPDASSPQVDSSAKVLRFAG